MVTPESSLSISQDAQLVGTWTLISVLTERDGKRFEAYGPGAKGSLVFDANGRYSIIFIAAGLPKFVSGNRFAGTADENAAVVAGSLAHFGTYVVDEPGKSFTFQIERATFPNWQGKNNKRSFVIVGDELRFTDPHASGGGVAATIFRRSN
ncbi:lipocalin-like domain-containing protein [Bradyrhizobium jicamae]|uniref:Lipocalin-like domain-containing protein n=1 Tax=Bradyrhizobium jicamae TaxID=280332 RepID=A0ABS5FDL2_9BRAD|nr:lipocalin-like domain-containing protein [Bradyrhizobium jicamae]MBR0794860.1 lipocalin-like domain-containing protein [Bradyrhizobium jicamae]